MPPPPILDPAELDLSSPIAREPEIARAIPQRHEFALLDAVVLVDADRSLFAGYHDVREDAYWVRGHIPGRPLFPGVLMIEVAAQLCSYLHHKVFQPSGFIGFVGVDRVKFRGAVSPPCRFLVMARGKVLKPRRLTCEVQGFVNEVMVFEGEISGMTM